MENSKPTFKQLIDETGLSDRKIYEKAGISLSAFNRIKQGLYVKDKTKWKLIHALNGILKRQYTIDDIA